VPVAAPVPDAKPAKTARKAPKRKR